MVTQAFGDKHSGGIKAPPPQRACLGRFVPIGGLDEAGGEVFVDDLRTALDALLDKLSRLPESKLTAGLDAGAGPARDGHALAQKLADAAAGIESWAAAAPAAGQPVPWVGPFVVADQLAVTGADLVAAADGLDAEQSVWSGAARCDLGSVLAECLATVLALSGRLGG